MADRSLRLDLLALELVVALGFTGCGGRVVGAAAHLAQPSAGQTSGQRR